jgi:hypothetical protein
MGCNETCSTSYEDVLGLISHHVRLQISNMLCVNSDITRSDYSHKLVFKVIGKTRKRIYFLHQVKLHETL